MIHFVQLGEDYPIFSDAPETSFLCDGRVAGYYADKEVDTTAFHCLEVIFNHGYILIEE